MRECTADTNKNISSINYSGNKIKKSKEMPVLYFSILNLFSVNIPLKTNTKKIIGFCELFSLRFVYSSICFFFSQFILSSFTLRCYILADRWVHSKCVQKKDMQTYNKKKNAQMYNMYWHK